MFKEYALDPDLFQSWSDLRYYAEKFGWPQGRLVSKYPNKWIQRLHSSVGSGSWKDSQRFIETLKKLKTCFISRRDVEFVSDISSDGSVWLRNVLHRHGELNFQGILAANTYGLKSPALFAGEEIYAGHPILQVSDGVILRRVREFASAGRLLLQTGERLLFVDPNFKAGEERFREPMKAMLEICHPSPFRYEKPEVELHISIGGDHRGDELIIGNRVSEEARQCQHWLPGILPEGWKMTVFIWLGRDGGEKFHNRYILTERAGITMGTGLDEDGDTNATSTDDWFRLSDTQHTRRWEQFQHDNCPFRLLAKKIVSAAE